MAISIDIGTRNVHLVSGQVNGNKIMIDRMIMDSIPSGLVQDGIIREFSSLELAMKNMFDKYKIKGKDGIITINGSHVYTRELDVPKAEPKIMSNVVSFEVQSTLNGNKDVVVEFIASKQQNKDNQNQVHVRASALQNDVVLDYAKLLHQLKMRPSAMDIHPNSISKLLHGRIINDTGTQDTSIMLIDIGCVSSTTYVINNGDIVYTRIIPIGAIDIERYVVNFNNNEKSEKKISLDDIDLSINYLRLNTDLGDVVRPLVMSLTDGVNRIQQFLSGRIQGNKVEKIYIYGRGSTFNGLEDTLVESMGLKIERIRSLSGVSLPEGVDPSPFLNAIGALIRLKN